MSLILMTTLFYKAVILQGEIWRWSFLGLKGLILLEMFRCTTMLFCTHDATFIYGIRSPRPRPYRVNWDRCQSTKYILFLVVLWHILKEHLWIWSSHLTLRSWNLSRMFDVWITLSRLKAVDILSSINYTNFRILELGRLLNVDRHSRFLSYFQC